MDNKILKIIDEDTNYEISSGRYEKPNQVVDLYITHSDSTNSDPFNEQYSCNAQIVSLDEFLQQSQTDIQESVSKGDKTNEQSECISSELGRKNAQELIPEDTQEVELSDSDLHKSVFERKILNLNTINPEVSENLFATENSNDVGS